MIRYLFSPGMSGFICECFIILKESNTPNSCHYIESFGLKPQFSLSIYLRLFFYKKGSRLTRFLLGASDYYAYPIVRLSGFFEHLFMISDIKLYDKIPI